MLHIVDASLETLVSRIDHSAVNRRSSYKEIREVRRWMISLSVLEALGIASHRSQADGERAWSFSTSHSPSLRNHKLEPRVLASGAMDGGDSDLEDAFRQTVEVLLKVSIREELEIVTAFFDLLERGLVTANVRDGMRYWSAAPGVRESDFG